MEYYKSITQSDLISLIQSTKKVLYFCMPSIHKEIADAITYLDYSSYHDGNNVAIHLLVDFDAQTFRQGYGDYQSVEELINGEFEVKTLKDIRISFILSDDMGYYLFIESRSLIPADKETINAVKIDPVSMVRLKKFFFTSAEETDFEDELTNAIIEESKKLERASELLGQNIAPVLEITKQEIDILGDDLERNPPLNPDYKRIVEFYSHKFQYVKLKFDGANLKSRKISLPPKALPIKDAALKERLETRLNLFDPIAAEKAFSPLAEFNKTVADLREKHLVKVKSREERLIDKQHKRGFQDTFDQLQKKLKILKNQTLLIIGDQIENTKERLIKELPDFFIENPDALFPDHPHIWENNIDYIKQQAQSQAKEIIQKHIHWPKAHELVDIFDLEVQYSDITFEDLKNEKFISELKEVGLIGEDDENILAEFSKGIVMK